MEGWIRKKRFLAENSVKDLVQEGENKKWKLSNALLSTRKEKRHKN